MEQRVQVPVQNVIGQSVFAGHFLHMLDPKKRLTIPAVWREQVGQPPTLYILPGLAGERCLNVYPVREMALRLEKLRQISLGDSAARSLARMIASRSELVSCDSQGRIRVRDELLQHAGITSQVQLISAWNHFQLWNPERYRQFEAAQPAPKSLEEAIQKMNM